MIPATSRALAPPCRSAGIRYGDLAVALEAAGLGARHHGLAAAHLGRRRGRDRHARVRRRHRLARCGRAGLELVGADGELRRVARGDAGLRRAGRGAGRPRDRHPSDLDVEPTYDVRQDVRTGLSWEVLESRFDEITAAAYSVSLFTRLDRRRHRPGVAQGPGGDDRAAAARALRRRAATATLHMLAGGATEAVTEQGGIAGPWIDRLPHFRMEFTPSRGEELQSEYLVPAQHALEAIERLRRLRRVPARCSRSPRSAPSPPTTSGSAAPTAATPWRCTSPGCAT